MWIKIARDAMEAGKVLELQYDGFVRCVEVHAVGYSKDRNAIMRVWQVRGGSASCEIVGWKLMRLDEVRGASVSDEDSQAPRAGYRRDDRAMQQIVCQI